MQRMLMQRMLVLLVAVSALGLGVTFSLAQDPAPPSAPPAEPRAAADAERQAAGDTGTAGREQLEKEFAELMTGATLAGHYTVSGEAPNGPLKEERYAIKKVMKLRDDLWILTSSIQYGEKDEVVVPVPLRVKWAGDTPVITLTDVPIPGLGTFTARVLVYRGQYAGTWSGGDHGGHLFGRVLRAGAEETEQPASGK